MTDPAACFANLIRSQKDNKRAGMQGRDRNLGWVWINQPSGGCVGRPNIACRGFLARKSGFTLLELLVVLAIVGVLLALTVPSYAVFQRKALAREGAIHLTALAALEEQLRLTKGQYQSAAVLLNSRALPASLTRHYRLSVKLDHSSGFLLSLQPLAHSMDYPLLSLDALGRRVPSDLWH